MSTDHSEQNITPRVSNTTTKSSETHSVAAENNNTQVDSKQSAPRRKFSNDYKLKTLEAYEACSNALARGELLRKEGLYYSRITYWRQQRDSGRLEISSHNRATKKSQKIATENAALKKKLAQAKAVIELQKKVSELLGQHILNRENNEAL